MPRPKPRALRPNLYSDVQNIIIQKKAQENGVHPDDQAIYALSQTRGWELLKAYIDSLKENLKSFQKEAMASGMSWEEIGKRTLLIELTNDTLDQIITKVDDSKDAVEEGTQTQKSEPAE